jgi:hypothetical protein
VPLTTMMASPLLKLEPLFRSLSSRGAMWWRSERASWMFS